MLRLITLSYRPLGEVRLSTPCRDLPGYITPGNIHEKGMNEASSEVRTCLDELCVWGVGCWGVGVGVGVGVCVILSINTSNKIE